MFAPAGFDASMDKWRTTGVYTRIKPLEHLPKKYSCIIFDRRETGGSGGRVERLTWAHYVAQGKGLLEHLDIKRAHLMGGCMGCSPVMAFAVMHPEMVQSMVLYWPVGGAKYRINTHQRFVQHLAYVNENGLEKVVALVRETGKTFGEDPRGGLWAQVIRNDPEFAATYAKKNVDQYKLIVTAIARTLFDRDTSPGAEPEDLMQLQIPALVVPGRDASHATSAARYVEECLPKSEYWDMPVAEQTEATAPARILQFLDGVAA
jgi:pimeloyl-ACP methyl ester carboxylesterase